MGAKPFSWIGPQIIERRGMKTCRRLPAVGRAGRECLSCLFFYIIIDKLFKGLTFLGQFTFSAAYFHMNFWVSLPFITDKVTHL
jgi:hypothetical protein